MTINIPTTYDQITLGQYCDFFNASSLFGKFKAISKLKDEELRDVPIADINKYVEQFELALKNVSAKFYQKIDIGTTNYGLIPNFSKLTGGEFADLMHYTSKERIITDLPKAMAILYRPITAVVGKTYAIERYEADLHMLNEYEMRTLTMDKVEGVLVFFSTIVSDLLSDSQTYLDNQLKEIQQMMSQD